MVVTPCWVFSNWALSWWQRISPPLSRVRRFGEAIITERGVRHGQINIVPVSLETTHTHDTGAHLHGQGMGHLHVKPEI